MEENRIRLRVLGITYNQIQSGAYALLLAQDGGNYRIPVVIGPSEAQAIAAKLENVVLPRPLVYDVFQSMSHAFGVLTKEIFIYRFHHGVFFSEIAFSDGEREVRIDSRTSDAIALALRSKAPIFTTPEILKETGFLVEPDDNFDKNIRESSHFTDDKDGLDVPLRRFAIPELEKMLKASIAKEAYERAAEIKKVIDEKKSNRQNKQ